MSGTGDMHDRGTPQHWQSVIDRLKADGDWEAAAALWDAKMKATLRFDLDEPDDARQHRYALAGLPALLALEEIDQWARGILKYGEPTTSERRALESLRAMIPHDLVELLHDNP